jgi:hypothetical protein
VLPGVSHHWARNSDGAPIMGAGTRYAKAACWDQWAGDLLGGQTLIELFWSTMHRDCSTSHVGNQTPGPRRSLSGSKRGTNPPPRHTSTATGFEPTAPARLVAA